MLLARSQATIQRQPAQTMISCMSPNSIMSDLRQLGANAASAAIGTAQLAFYIPFTLPSTEVVTQVWAYNGAVAAGTIDIGVFNAAGSKVLSSGATNQVGTNNLQVINTTDTTITPGLYYLALNCSNNTATFFTYTSSLQVGRAAGVFTQAVGADALPATFTLAALAVAIIPIFGISLGVP